MTGLRFTHLQRTPPGARRSASTSPPPGRPGCLRKRSTRRRGRRRWHRPGTVAAQWDPASAEQDLVPELAAVGGKLSDPRLHLADEVFAIVGVQELGDVPGILRSSSVELEQDEVRRAPPAGRRRARGGSCSGGAAGRPAAPLAAASEHPLSLVCRHAVRAGEGRDGLPSELLGETQTLERRKRQLGSALIPAQRGGDIGVHAGSIAARPRRSGRRGQEKRGAGSSRWFSERL